MTNSQSLKGERFVLSCVSSLCSAGAEKEWWESLEEESSSHHGIQKFREKGGAGPGDTSFQLLP